MTYGFSLTTLSKSSSVMWMGASWTILGTSMRFETWARDINLSYVPAKRPRALGLEPPRRLQNPQRVQGDHRARAPAAPVHDLDVRGPLPRGRPVEALCAPSAVGGPLTLHDVERLPHARASQREDEGEDPQRLEDVVVPVQRVVELEPLWVDHLARLLRAEQTVTEEELRRPLRGLQGPIVAR